jgi:hypothetical protein
VAKKQATHLLSQAKNADLPMPAEKLNEAPCLLLAGQAKKPRIDAD